MAYEIEAGDVVQLKSGGPKMTVKDVVMIDGEITAWCEWRIDEKSESETFPLLSLKRVD
jgi:uncharacterized protein YodC (DUF2158 family)